MGAMIISSPWFPRFVKCRCMTFNLETRIWSRKNAPSINTWSSRARLSRMIIPPTRITPQWPALTTWLVEGTIPKVIWGCKKRIGIIMKPMPEFALGPPLCCVKSRVIRHLPHSQDIDLTTTLLNCQAEWVDREEWANSFCDRNTDSLRCHLQERVGTSWIPTRKNWRDAPPNSAKSALGQAQCASPWSVCCCTGRRRIRVACICRCSAFPSIARCWCTVHIHYQRRDSTSTNRRMTCWTRRRVFLRDSPCKEWDTWMRRGKSQETMEPQILLANCFYFWWNTCAIRNTWMQLLKPRRMRAFGALCEINIDVIWIYNNIIYKCYKCLMKQIKGCKWYDHVCVRDHTICSFGFFWS